MAVKSTLTLPFHLGSVELRKISALRDWIGSVLQTGFDERVEIAAPRYLLITGWLLHMPGGPKLGLFSFFLLCEDVL